jgi:hypothetical protein
MEKVANNGYKLYFKTKHSASSESFRRSKEILPQIIHVHPKLSKMSCNVHDKIEEND